MVRVHAGYVRILGLTFDESSQNVGVEGIGGHLVYLDLRVNRRCWLCGGRGEGLGFMAGNYAIRGWRGQKQGKKDDCASECVFQMLGGSPSTRLGHSRYERED